jgi:hypothetical protein
MNVSEKVLPSIPTKRENPIADSPETRHFRKVVEEGNANAIISIFNGGNDELKEYCSNYLAQLESSKLARLSKQKVWEKGDAEEPEHEWSWEFKEWMFGALLEYAHLSLLDSIYYSVKPRNTILSRYGCSKRLLIDLPGRFFYFLSKFNFKAGQEDSVEWAVRSLFDWDKTECFDHLLLLLRKGTFLSRKLGKIAISEAFKKASEYNDDRSFFAKRFFDHPKVSPENYSDALYNSYFKGGQNKELFHWLLERADRQDLEMVKGAHTFSSMDSKFQEVISVALQNVDSYTRSGSNA